MGIDLNHVLAGIVFLRYGGGEVGGGVEAENHADSLADIFQHDAPVGGGGLREEEGFDVAAAGFAEGEAGGDDAGVVEDEKVAGSQELGEVGEGAVVDRAVGTAVVEQARGGALDRWRLGDQFGGEGEVEVVGSHFSFRTGRMPVIRRGKVGSGVNNGVR